MVPALLQKQSDGDQVDHIGLIYIPSGTYRTRVLTPALVCQSVSSTALSSFHAKVGDQNLKEPRKGRPSTTKWRRPGMTAPGRKNATGAPWKEREHELRMRTAILVFSSVTFFL